MLTDHNWSQNLSGIAQRDDQHRAALPHSVMFFIQNLSSFLVKPVSLLKFLEVSLEFRRTWSPGDSMLSSKMLQIMPVRHVQFRPIYAALQLQE